MPSQHLIPHVSSAGRFRLGFQLLCTLCIIAGIVALSTGFLIARGERSYIVALMDNEHERKLELVVAATLENMISEDVPQIETTMSQLIKRDPNVRKALLRNETGKILYRFPRSDEIVDNDDENLRTFHKEIIFEGEKFGEFTVVWDTSSIISEGRARAFRMALLIGAVCLFLGSLVYLFIRLFMIWPIQKLSRDVKAIRNGDYRVNGRSGGLHRFVATEIDDMAASVHELRHHLVQKEIYENELNLAKESAEQANRAKSDFLANVSHELRTPLNAIIGFSEMMSTQLFGKIGDERYVAYARDINHSGNHLLGLINDILDISRIEAGKLILNVDAMDLPGAIDAAANLMTPMLEEKNVELSLSVADDIPEIVADSQRVRQILINLLSNAVKFTNADGKVSLSAECDGKNGVLITIADTGIGIEPGDIHRILRPFEQIETAFTREHDGSGLGLPITMALVESHGGTMQIESAPGEGTCISVRLPVTAATRAAPPADDPDLQNDVAPLAGPGPALRRIA